MKTYNINVTKRDIKNGVKTSITKCPIALSCRRYKKLKNARIRNFDLIIRCESYDLPKEAIEFIESFDRDYEVKPFKFQIEI